MIPRSLKKPFFFLYPQDVLDALNCGSDEVACLRDASAEDLTNAEVEEWGAANTPDLPKSGEEASDHSWVIIDKDVIFQNVVAHWRANRQTNKIPMVFGEYTVYR